MFFVWTSTAVWLLLITARTSAQTKGGGMLLPDTVDLPRINVEHWQGLPAGPVLSRHVDLSRWFPPAGDQGRQSSCVAWALSYGAMSYRRNRWDDRIYAPHTPVDSANTSSPAYLHNLITSFDRSPTEALSEQACLNGPMRRP